MALVAFLDRVRILALGEDFEAAQTELELMRCCIFDGEPNSFGLSCRINFLSEEEPERTVTLEVDEQMTFGLVKNKLKENFAKLAGFRLTLIAGKVVPLDTATLQAHKITSDGCVIFVLATPQGTYPEHNKNSVNGRYVPAKELSIKQVPPEEAIQLLDQLEGPLMQKKVLESVEVAENLRDSLKAWNMSPDQGIGRIQVLKRLKVQVENVRGPNAHFVIPRVHLKTRIGRLKTEVETRLTIPAQIQRWFFRNEIKGDDCRLEDMIDKNSQMVSELEVVLYLVTPETAGISGRQVAKMYEELQDRVMTNEDPLSSLSDDSGDEAEKHEIAMTSQNDVTVDKDDNSDIEDLVHVSDEFEPQFNPDLPVMGSRDPFFVNYAAQNVPYCAQDDGHGFPNRRASFAERDDRAQTHGAVLGGATPKPMWARRNLKAKPTSQSINQPKPPNEGGGDSVDASRTVSWTCSVCSVATNRPYFEMCELCGQGTRPDNFVIPSWYIPDQEESNKIKQEQLNEQWTRSLLQQQQPGGDLELEEDPYLLGAYGGDGGRTPADVDKDVPLVAWTCGRCSVRTNRPHFKICEVCGEGTRPQDFVIPNWYKPDKDEQKKIQQEDINDKLFRDLVQAEKVREQQEADARYAALQRAENSVGCYPNYEPFECPVCMENVGIGEGTILRLCHHCICNECLKGHLTASENGLNISCPYMDDNGTKCEQMISQQEIRAALDQESFEKLLQSAISQAEAAEPNSFHCKTADCPGWCIVEDDLNFFDCANCGKRSCLTCAAQHHPMNCKEYQDDVKLKAANDEAAKATQEMLQRLLASGEAINCPGCKVIVQKKSGCDWMQCSMCKTEICWATRGPRWGPGGRGELILKERFEKFRLEANREFDISNWREHFYRIAESQFNRLNRAFINKKYLRCVDYFTNTVLERRFKRKQAEFIAKYGENQPWSKEVFQFHGTPFQYPEVIMKENFDMNKIRRARYGRGIYFSDYPQISMGYGKNLILARVLLGKQGDATKCNTRDNCPEHDSHYVWPDQQNYAHQVIITNVDQILPMFILHVV